MLASWLYLSIFFSFTLAPDDSVTLVKKWRKREQFYSRINDSTLDMNHDVGADWEKAYKTDSEKSQRLYPLLLSTLSTKRSQFIITPLSAFNNPPKKPITDFPSQLDLVISGAAAFSPTIDPFNHGSTIKISHRLEILTK